MAVLSKLFEVFLYYFEELRIFGRHRHLPHEKLHYIDLVSTLYDQKRGFPSCVKSRRIFSHFFRTCFVFFALVSYLFGTFVICSHVFRTCFVFFSNFFRTYFVLLYFVHTVFALFFVFVSHCFRTCFVLSYMFALFSNLFRTCFVLVSQFFEKKKVKTV